MWETRNGGDSTASEEKGERERGEVARTRSVVRSSDSGTSQRHKQKPDSPKQRQQSKEVYI